jgi:hypothetical protein
MVITVKGTIWSDLNMAPDCDIGNERMNSASGLYVRALADMNVCPQSSLKATISIKMNPVAKLHPPPCCVSRDHHTITEIHMSTNRGFRIGNHHRRRKKSLGTMIRKMGAVVKRKCSQAGNPRSQTTTYAQT